MSAAIYQVVLAAVISLCFAVVFNVHGRKMLIAAVGGTVLWAIYLSVRALTGSIFGGIFAAAAISGLLSELLARKMRAPVTVFLVPALLPLFPGGDLYYAAASLVRSDGSFPAAASLVLKEAGAIAGGIIVSTTLVQAYYRIRLALRRKKREAAENQNHN